MHDFISSSSSSSCGTNNFFYGLNASISDKLLLVPCVLEMYVLEFRYNIVKYLHIRNISVILLKKNVR